MGVRAMRILVYPHAMEIGGSQLNAVQLAGAVRDRGHEVIVISEPGPLVDRVRAMDLEHIEIPMNRRRPSPEVLAQLVRVVRGRRIDVVHGYEWPPVVEAFFGPGLRLRTAVVGTVMSMSVVPFFPRTVPLVVGTEAIRAATQAAGQHRVTLLEPPVDTDSDNPDVDGRDFRRQHGIPADEVLVAMVCRLVPELKLEGLLAACDAVGDLAAAGHRVQLVLVGDGRSREEIEERAAKVNAQAGRTVVRLTGEVTDPRPAYAAADVIVGQGGSALRGMAFGKPLVVVGEQGFSSLLTPESAPLFLEQGWYGLGGKGVPELRSSLERLVESPEQRAELGAFARRLVVDRFALRRAARVQEDEYLNAFRTRPALASVGLEVVRSGGGVVASKLLTKYQRWRGTVATDDANARPIVVTHGKA
jgi:glycosyltransferase involved in cell wall biosynthesis